MFLQKDVSPRPPSYPSPMFLDKSPRPPTDEAVPHPPAGPPPMFLTDVVPHPPPYPPPMFLDDDNDIIASTNNALKRFKAVGLAVMGARDFGQLIAGKFGCFSHFV